jgi:hypothetical protein
MRWAVFIVFAALSCASTHVEGALDSAPLPAICPEGVAVFPDSNQIGKPFTHVATLRSQGSMLFPDQNAIFDSQRKTAARLGANGLILVLKGLSADNDNSANANRVIAINIPGDSLRVATACGRH